MKVELPEQASCWLTRCRVSWVAGWVAGGSVVEVPPQKNWLNKNTIWRLNISQKALYIYNFTEIFWISVIQLPSEAEPNAAPSEACSCFVFFFQSSDTDLWHPVFPRSGYVHSSLFLFHCVFICFWLYDCVYQMVCCKPLRSKNFRGIEPCPAPRNCDNSNWGSWLRQAEWGTKDKVLSTARQDVAASGW